MGEADKLARSWTKGANEQRMIKANNVHLLQQSHNDLFGIKGFRRDRRMR
jgi:hypothetical protein